MHLILFQFSLYLSMETIALGNNFLLYSFNIILKACCVNCSGLFNESLHLLLNESCHCIQSVFIMNHLLFLLSLNFLFPMHSKLIEAFSNIS